MSLLRFSLFGKLQIQMGEQHWLGIEARKAQELLCYLLIHRGRPHCRETLASLLWGEATTAQSKKYLRQTLWQLQAGLDSHHPNAQAALFTADPEWIYVDLKADIWADVVEFEETFVTLKALPGNQLCGEEMERLHCATQLYRGDLLEGWYQDWCIYERERFQTMFLAMLDRLMAYCEANHEYERGVFYGLHILRYDRARESTHRRLMRLRALAGDRTGALRQYAACVAALAEELAVEPAASTTMLYHLICADRLDPNSLAVASIPSGPCLRPPALSAAVDQLKLLQSSLAGLSTQIEACVQTLKGY